MTKIHDFVAAARRGSESAPTTTLDLLLADCHLRVNLVGEGMSGRLAAGLLTGDAAGTPSSEIWAFDTAGTGVKPPPPPWGRSAYQEQRDELIGFSEPPTIATWDQEFATLSIYDEPARQGVQWIRDAAGLHPGEGGAPMRNLLRWALGADDVHVLHAAAAGGVLLCGLSGAGKSTTSFACLLAGLDFTADDHCAVRISPDGVTADAIFAFSRATPETMQLLPGLNDFSADVELDWNNKKRLRVADRIVRSQAINAIVLPVRAEQTGDPRRLDPQEALRRMTVGNLLMMPGATGRTLGALRQLLEQLPAWELPVGDDLAAVADRVAALGAPQRATA